MILQEAMANNKCETALMDMKAAYDTVPRARLWSKLKIQFGIKLKVIQILQALFDGNESILCVKGRHSDPIPNKRELLQGSALSPILFNFFINDLVRKCEQLKGVLTYGQKTSILAFADDVALVANSPLDLQKSVNTAQEWAISNGMTFSVPNCMYLGHKGVAPKLGSDNITRCDRAESASLHSLGKQEFYSIRACKPFWKFYKGLKCGVEAWLHNKSRDNGWQSNKQHLIE
jgi:hypothetical protein